MKIVDSFPRDVCEIENAWIPLPDGCRLAARIWLPRDAEVRRVPAIVEYLPYGKRDGTRERDEPMHRYFAGHGYAAVRIDLRGTGESDGLLSDEYTEQELDDAVAAIAWIAAQPWSSGAVGMMGKSWGGINALQVAARRPPALKAVVTVCSTDDRYADDAHYMGGCLLNENLLWGSTLFTLAALPPDPQLVGERWRSLWRRRLEHLPLYAATWLAHPTRDDYWRRGSVCEDYAAIQCPVFAVGGWADAYTNAVPRLLAGLSVPRRGLVGPWAHLYPHEGVPGPAIGFLQEALRWWDRWLKGIDTGIGDEPMYRVWMQESVPPRSSLAQRPGRWVAERSWPSPRIGRRTWRLAPGLLSPAAGDGATGSGAEGRLDHRSPQTVGAAAGAWCSFGQPGDLPADQRVDDDRSLTFDSPPLGERLEILGAPQVILELAVDRRRAFVAVRLNDVAPDGASARVTYGLLDLSHRGGNERAEAMIPGRRETLRVRLNDVAHAFPAGHRLRVAVSTAYWPLAWPSPSAVTLSLFTGGASRLELPVRPPDPADAALRPLPPPEGGPPAETTDLHPGGVERTVVRDPATGETVVTISLDVEGSGGGDAGAAGGVAMSRVDAIDLETGHSMVERFRIVDDDPLSARAEVVHRVAARRGDWSVRVETRSRLSASEDAFRLEAEVEAYEGETRVFARTWDESLRRPPDQ